MIRTPALRQILGTGTGTFNADFTAFILNQDLDYQLVHDEVAKRKLKVAPADLEQAKNTVIQQVNGQDTFNAFPKWYQDKLQQRFAEVIVLAKSFGVLRLPQDDSLTVCSIDLCASNRRGEASFLSGIRNPK